VNSGTSALHLALLALGIGPGHEVIVPSFTFAATANVVALTGAKPVFVDINPQSFCMSPESASAAITKRTKAVIPVHLYGHPADMTALQDICETNGLFLLEDAAQAHGATWMNKKVGTWGDVGAFSFYPTKNMTSGEGGMVVTSDPSIARVIRLLRNQGQERRYENEIVGYNNRMTDIHAAIGRVQLRKVSTLLAKRTRIAEIYSSSLVNVMLPTVASNAKHVFHQYTIRVEANLREDVVIKLKKMGIETGVYYPIPVHKLPSFQDNVFLPNTEEISREVISLPIYPSLGDRQIQRIVNSVNQVTRAGA
jgi:dTDP-4-amino-4,6-dideoxygalactose transaminase